MRRSKATLGVVASVGALAACSPTPNVLPSNDFNRPTDLAFMCFGAFDPNPVTGDAAEDSDGGVAAPLQVSGRPMTWCHPPGPGSTNPDPGATVQTRTFAFMPNSASGELSVIDADRWKIVDLDSSTGGYGRLPLGKVPEQIATTSDGCRLVSANRGSCDLTLVDPSALLAPVFEANYGGLAKPLPDARAAAQTIAPVKGDGTLLRSSPYEVAFFPRDIRDLTGAQNLCPDSNGSPSVPWRALVTFPSCDMVALIDFPSGQIVDAARIVDSGGKPVLENVGTSPSCPADCGVLVAAPSGDSDGGATTSSVRSLFGPSGIAMTPDGSTAYVSLSRNDHVIPINFGGGTIRGATPIQIAGAGGSTRLRLNVEPYRYLPPPPTQPGEETNPTPPVYLGRYVGDSRRYLYVIARDGSLRVIDLNLGTECDTNVDPSHLPKNTTPATDCFDATTSAAYRRPFPRPDASGPGVRFPSIPIDVVAADIRPTENLSSEATVAGGYAWVLTSSGAVFLVNISPVRRNLVIYEYDRNTGKAVKKEMEPEALPFANTKRDRNQMSYSSAQDPSSGPPRVPLPPPLSFAGPYLESFWTKGSRANAAASGDSFLATPVYFPDPTAVTPQAWAVTWEGALISGRHGGQLREDGKGLNDGANFCDRGVLPGDTVTFNGCNTNAGCIPGFKCYKDPTITEAAGGFAVTGLCVDPAQEKALTKNDALFQTIRRYEIVSARQNTLELEPHLDELVYADIGGRDRCANDTGVDPGTPDGGADGGVTDAGGEDGGADDGGSEDAGTAAANAPTPTDGSAGAGETGDGGSSGKSCGYEMDQITAKFECVASPRWAGTGPAPRRCLRRCETDQDCRRGRICLEVKDSKDAGKSKGKFCADAPQLSELAPILGQIVTYSLNVGGGFLVSGGQVGTLTSGVTDGNGYCGPSDRDPRLVARIPVRTVYDHMGSPLLQTRSCPFFASNEDDHRGTAQIDTTVCRTEPVPASARCWPERFPLDKNLNLTRDNNPCLYLGGPAGADPAANPGMNVPAARHVRAMLQNTEISFVLANVDVAPPSGFEVRFDVNGGFRAQAVGYPSTVEVSTPARIVVGPVDSQPQTVGSSFEAPYLFVVDQRRLGRAQAGGSTRGQIVRIHPLVGGLTVGTSTGFQPVYEDYSRSGGLFPIQ